MEISAPEWLQQAAVLIQLVVVLIPVVSILQPAAEASIRQQPVAALMMLAVSMSEAWMPAVSMQAAWIWEEIPVLEAASAIWARMAAAWTLARKECGELFCNDK